RSRLPERRDEIHTSEPDHDRRQPHRQVEGLCGIRRARYRKQGHLPAPDHQHTVRRGAGEHLVGDVSLHRPVRLQESGSERLVLPLLSADSLPDSPAQAISQHHSQGLHVRANTEMEPHLDRRGPVRQVRPQRRRGRVHRVDGSPDGSEWAGRVSRPIAEILAPKPDLRLQIYAWSPNDPPADYVGLVKVGQTTREDVNARIRQSQGQMQQGYTLHLTALAEREDGSTFRDSDVRQRLIDKGFENVVIGSAREWMRCSPDEVKTAVTELQKGLRLTGSHHETFAMRREQAEAVNKTHAYFHSIWSEDMHAVPRFLWNAKMRFGKTFTTYQLAKKLGAKRVLVVTFKPVVEDAWQTDLENHVDFDGWQYLSRNSDLDPTEINPRKPVVYFGSFQDLLGRDKTGNIKPKNEWLHTVNWDLVVFDEYHFGAWRDTAKELFEGEDDAVAKKEAKLEYAADLDAVNEDLSELSEAEPEFLPITSRAYLYLSGTPFRALSTGEFIEEQIFNWTYTDEQ